MQKTKRHRTNFISTVIVITTLAVLTFLTIVLINHVTLETRFYTIINWLQSVDSAVAGLDSKWEIIICIFALYIAKCQLPIPMSILVALSGMVFPLWTAILINVVFCLFFFTVKYVEGIYIGGGWAGIILNFKRMHFIRDWIHFKGKGNPYVLATTRLIPAISLSMVSKYYGSMRYDYLYYIIMSLAGFFPRIYIYTKLGTALKNPFSPQFLVPLIIIVAFTGVTSLLYNVFYGVKSKQMTQTLLIYSDVEKYKIVL
ncbi:MAG: TVP38/TMEM64 family protein [Eubacterium sp.]|nr:TVP38/TMEM64 family protein [Eubacterium sp.]